MSDFVVLYSGSRGPEGVGKDGPPGPPGPGFRARGAWVLGQTYAPGDAVSASGSTVQGIDSLFVQRTTFDEAVSDIPPRDAPGRWMEIGAADLSNVTGAIWRVHQIAHGFEYVGTPVGYGFSAGRWITANNRLGDDVTAAVGLIREVVSADEFIVQTTGEIAGLQPEAISELETQEFIAGRVYYVSKLRGRLTLDPTEPAPGFASNAVLMATGPDSGVVLQWQQTPNVVGRRPVGFDEYRFVAEPGQTVFSGEDENGNTLTYQVSPQSQLYVDGLLLPRGEGYSAVDGLTVVLDAPAAGGETVVFRPLTEPLQTIAPATAVMADNIGTLFDGSVRRFPLTVGGGSAVALGPAQNAMVFLDGSPQEPFADYRVIAGDTTDSDIEFTSAPPPGTRFWAVVGTAVSNLSFIEVNTLLASVGTIQTLNFNNATGGAIETDTLDVAVEATFAAAYVEDFSALAVDTNTLSFETASGATLTLGGLADLTEATVSGNLQTQTLDVLVSATVATATVSGVLQAQSVEVVAGAIAASLTVSGAAQTQTLTVSDTAEADIVDAQTRVRAPLIRVGELRGFTDGTDAVAMDLLVDEGTF